jgi:hypothetical protein
MILVYYKKDQRRQAKYAKAVPMIQFYQDTLGLYIDKLTCKRLLND